MHLIQFVVVAITFIGSACCIPSGIQDASFNTLDGVDGKLFVYTNLKMNWTAAKEYVLERNIRMGSITSKAQADLLNSQFRPGDFDGYYWTSGRDALALKQYSWDNSYVEPNNDYLKYSGDYKTIHSCLYFQSDDKPGTSVYGGDCSEEYGILAEYDE